MNLSEPVIMTISAFDPLGEAGVIADLKTFGANGCYGVAAISAIDVQQRPSGLKEVDPVDVHILQACMRSVMTESKVQAINLLRHATYSITANICYAGVSDEKREAHRGVLHLVTRTQTRTGQGSGTSAS